MKDAEKVGLCYDRTKVPSTKCSLQNAFARCTTVENLSFNKVLENIKHQW